ncbi:endonuclease/exonuclease/phosphatase family protein [Streptomyces formicae]
MRIVLPAFLLAGLLAFPGVVPDTPGHIGSLVETVLPWFGLGVPCLVLGAALRRSRTGLAAALVPATVWAALFGPAFLPERAAAQADFQVLTLNVGGDRTTPREVARQVIDTHADVVALEKVPGPAMKEYAKQLDATYPHHVTRNTLGLWSRYPLTDVEALHLGGAWPHALRASARTPGGDTAVYAVRLPSVRVTPGNGFAVRDRDASAAELAERVKADPARRVVLLGDLNGSLRDRGLAPLARALTDVREGAGRGPGFTWPAAFPVVRIDHVLTRGLQATGTRVLPDLGSDHRPVLTGLRS